VCCNLSGLKHPSLSDPPAPLPDVALPVDGPSFSAAVAAAAAALQGAAKPVLLAGPRLRAARRRAAFVRVAEASGLPVAVTADGRGAFPEDHKQLLGTYWLVM
jgi:pyruvate decarboxylase